VQSPGSFSESHRIVEAWEAIAAERVCAGGNGERTGQGSFPQTTCIPHM